MLTVTGKFEFGVEIDGVVHKDFELRETTIRDGIEYLGKAKQDKQDTEDNLVIAVYKGAQQMIKLGTLTAGQITADLLLGMNEEDFIYLIDAQDELVKKRKSLKPSSKRIPK